MNVTRRGFTVAVSLVILTLPAPAYAHHGYAGPVLLYLDSVRLEPAGHGWLMRVGLNDSKSGEAAPGFTVEAAGTGPEGPIGPAHLTDLDGDGRYEAPLGPLPAGDWSLTLDVAEAPGAEERAVPIRRTWPVTLTPGRPTELVGRAAARTGTAPSGSSGSSAVTTTLGGAGALVLLAGTATWLKLSNRGYKSRRVRRRVGSC